jgi:hypothetical protein
LERPTPRIAAIGMLVAGRGASAVVCSCLHKTPPNSSRTSRLRVRRTARRPELPLPFTARARWTTPKSARTAEFRLAAGGRWPEVIYLAEPHAAATARPSQHDTLPVGGIKVGRQGDIAGDGSDYDGSFWFFFKRRSNIRSSSSNSLRIFSGGQDIGTTFSCP